MKRAFIASAVVLLASHCTPTFANVQSPTSGTNFVSSGSWGVQAFALNQAPTNSPYTITWGVSQGTAYSYFSIRNTGTFTVNGFNVAVTQIQIGGSGKPNDTTFNLCSNGVWNTSTNTCSGASTLIGSSADLVLAFTNLTFTAGSDLSVQATTKPNLKNAFTTTLSVSIDRTQIRGGVATNS